MKKNIGRGNYWETLSTHGPDKRKASVITMAEPHPQYPNKIHKVTQTGFDGPQLLHHPASNVYGNKNHLNSIVVPVVPNEEKTATYEDSGKIFTPQPYQPAYSYGHLTGQLSD
ncbi:hypothetical protein Hamer_G008583, partial [Homarus americanus]